MDIHLSPVVLSRQKTRNYIYPEIIKENNLRMVGFGLCNISLSVLGKLSIISRSYMAF